MNVRRPTWTLVSLAMILALLLTAIMPGLQGSAPQVAAQEASNPLVTPAPGEPAAEPTIQPGAGAEPSPTPDPASDPAAAPGEPAPAPQPATGPEPASPEAAPTGEPANPLPADLEGKTELTGQRTMDSATYDMGDGTFALVQEDQPMHYQDADGAWQRIDPAFEAVEDGWLNSTNVLHIGLASQRPSARITLGADAGAAAGAGFEPQAVWLVDAGGGEQVLAQAVAADQASPGTLSADGRSVTYPGSWSDPGLSDEWRSDYGSAAYSLVLAATPRADPAAAPVALELQVTLRVMPGTQLTIDGIPVDAAQLPLEGRAALEFTSSQGEAFTLQPPEAYELGNPGVRISGSYRLAAAAEPGAFDLRLRAPWSWLSNPARVYPVAMWPIFQVKSGNTVARALYYNSSHAFKEIIGVPAEVGQFSNYVERLLARFLLPALPTGTTILNAFVTLRASGLNYVDRAYLAAYLELYPLTNTAWTTPAGSKTDPPYNAGRSQGSRVVSCSGHQCNEAVWNITDLAKEWRADATGGAGVLFKIANEFCFYEDDDKIKYPEDCGGFYVPYPSEYTPDPVAVDQDLPKKGKGGLRLVVYYAGPTLNEGEMMADPSRKTGGINNPGGRDTYWWADHEYRLNPLPAGRWQAIVARAWGADFTLTPPPGIDYLKGRNQVGQVALGLRDTADAKVNVGSPNDNTLSYIALSGRKAPGKGYRARVTEPSPESRPDYYDIKLIGELTSVAPALNQVAIWPSADSSATFSTEDALALLNVALPAGTVNFRVDVEILSDNGLEKGQPFANQMYDYVRGFGGRLFTDVEADAIGYSEGSVLNVTWEGQSGIVPYGTGRLGSIPGEPRAGNYALALAYKGPQISFGYLAGPKTDSISDHVNRTLTFAYKVRVVACGQGMLASKKGCQRVACPAASFNSENRRDAGGLQLWSQDGWNAPKAGGAATSIANQYAPLIGGPGSAVPRVAVVGGQITYNAGSGGDVSVSPDTNVYLINCGAALGGSLQGSPIAVYETLPGGMLVNPKFGTLSGGTLERALTVPAAAPMLLPSGPGIRLFRPWDEADRVDLSAEQFWIFPVAGTANGQAVLTRRTGTNLAFNTDWSVAYTGWPSFAYHIARDSTVEPPSIASLSIELGDTVDIDVDVKPDLTRVFRAVRAREAIITQAPELGGASGPVQVLILPVGVQRPSDPPKGCADANKAPMSCVDLRALDDTATHENRLWQMPDVHIEDSANMVAMSTAGQLHVWSTDHPGATQAAEGMSQQFAFDTFGGSVTVEEAPCEAGGTTNVTVVRGETRMAMPMIGGGGESTGYVAAKFKLCSTSLREVGFEFSYPPGIPLGNSGLFVTGMQGTIGVYPEHTTLKFGMDFQAGQGSDGGIVKGHGDVTIDTLGYFAFAGQATLLSFVNAHGDLWVAWDPLDIGFKVEIAYGDWLTGSARVHMWQGQGWQHRYSWLPNNDEKHFAAAVSAEISIDKGKAFSWWFIDIPPWDMSFGIEVAFGQFCTNSNCSAYEWGVKGAFSVAGYHVGLYFGFFSHGFDFILGNDDHVLIDEFGGAMAAASTTGLAATGVLAAAAGEDGGLAPSATSQTRTFIVNANTMSILLGFSWQWQASPPQIKIYKPGNIEVVTNASHTVEIFNTTHTNPTAYARLIGVKFEQPPTAGEWRAEITGLTGKEHLVFVYLANKGAPSLTFSSVPTGKFLAPAVFGENATNSYLIRWQVPANTPDTATISLYGQRYEKGMFGWTEVNPEFTIVQHLSYKAGSYQWDSRWQATGYYAFRAVVDDGVNDFPEGSYVSDDSCEVRGDEPPERAFAENRFPGLVTFKSMNYFYHEQPAGLVRIVDTVAPPAPTGLALTPVSRGMLATWSPVDVKDIAGYQVYWGVARYTTSGWQWMGARHFERVNASGTPSLRIVGLNPDMGSAAKLGLNPDAGPIEKYGVQVYALDASGNASPGSAVAYDLPLATGIGMPQAPTSPVVVYNSQYEVKFSWQAPAIGPAPAGYRVISRRLAPSEDESYQDVVIIDVLSRPPNPVASTVVYIDELETGRAYDFRVSSLSSEGWVSASTEPVVVTVTDGKDSNGDGLPEDWVGTYFRGVFFPYIDSDLDGQSNKQEYLAHTDPMVQDTDHDGFTDGEEIQAGTDPLNGSSFPAQHTQPRLEVETQTLKFLHKQGEAPPQAQYVHYGNTAGGALVINPSSSEPWINASIVVIGRDKPIAISVDPAGMSPGYYTGVVRLLKGPDGDPLIGRPQCIRVETWVLANDDDVRSTMLLVSPKTISVIEGLEFGRGVRYKVSLGVAPKGNVTVTPHGNLQITVSPAALTFTPANWNVPQDVTVTAVNDLAAEGLATYVIRHTASGPPPWTGAYLPGVAVNVSDNDSAGVYITPASVSVSEGGPAASYSLSLTSKPSADVRVTPSAGAPLTVSPAVLTFTPANWNVSQKFNVSAANDGITNGARTVKIGHSVSSRGDLHYAVGLDVATVDVVVRDIPHFFLPLMTIQRRASSASD